MRYSVALIVQVFAIGCVLLPSCANEVRQSETLDADSSKYSIKVLPAAKNSLSNIAPEPSDSSQQSPQGDNEEEGGGLNLADSSDSSAGSAQSTECWRVEEVTARIQCFESQRSGGGTPSSNTPTNPQQDSETSSPQGNTSGQSAGSNSMGTFLKQANAQASKLAKTQLCFIPAGDYELSSAPKYESATESSSYYVTFANAVAGCPASGYLASVHVQVKGGGGGGGGSSDWKRPVGSRYPITSDHCKPRRCTKCSNPHQGIDFGAPAGTTVGAPANGQVAYSGWINGYGNVVAIHHENNGGLTSRLAHNKFRPTIQRGTRVAMGQAVSISGCTGTCFGAHVHMDLNTGHQTSFGYQPADFSPHTLTPTPRNNSGRVQCAPYRSPPKSSKFR